MPYTIPQLVVKLRALTRDIATDKVIFGEQLGGADLPQFPVNGTNVVFKLKNIPLSDASGSPVYSWITIVGTGGTVRTQAGFTITDPLNGIITFGAAPNPGSANPGDGVYVDYNWQYFTDAEYTEFLSQAANATLAGVTDATAIVEGLVEAMMQFGVAAFWRARASYWADRYETTGGDASAKPQDVTKAFLALAMAADKQAQLLQDRYYQRQGQRNEPSSQDGNVNFDPISPIR